MTMVWGNTRKIVVDYEWRDLRFEATPLNSNLFPGQAHIVFRVQVFSQKLGPRFPTNGGMHDVEGIVRREKVAASHLFICYLKSKPSSYLPSRDHPPGPGDFRLQPLIFYGRWPGMAHSIKQNSWREN